MIKTQPIFYVNGWLITILSGFMLLPAFAEWYDAGNNVLAFIVSSLITAFCGVFLIIANDSIDSKKQNLSLRQAFLLTVLSWLLASFFAAIPFALTDLKMSFVDAFFESVSGLTTTGATVLSNLENTSKGVLLWRAILQWVGGIGIIVMTVAILPMLKIGGMQLFRRESSDKTEKMTLRVKQVAHSIIGVYTLFTIFCIIALWVAGMQEFDALCHAMTTIATGGFSNYDNSIAHFANVRIELTMVIFMILSSLPFVIYVHFFNGRNFSIFSDLQVKLFFILLIIVVITMTLWLYFANHVPFIYALRDSLFNMTSVMTTSGFSTARYDNWGNFAIVMIFLVSVIGGCMGSTAGGIKIFRYQILFKTATQQIDKLIHPHRVFNFYYGDRPVSTEVKSSVINFFILFAASFTFIAALLPIVDHNIDFLTSVSAAASAIANAGPALGNIAGPGGHYGSFTDPAKLLLTLGMLVGRLELFTILVLLSPKFWRG